MTEKQLYAKIKPWLSTWGYSSRVENAVGSGMPDVIYATKRGVMYIELKIEHSGKIKLEPYQLAFATKCLKFTPQGFYWFCVWRKDIVEVYYAEHIISGEFEPVEKGMTLKLKGIPSAFCLVEHNSAAAFSYM